MVRGFNEILDRTLIKGHHTGGTNPKRSDLRFRINKIKLSKNMLIGFQVFKMLIIFMISKFMH